MSNGRTGAVIEEGSGEPKLIVMSGLHTELFMVPTEPMLRKILVLLACHAGRALGVDKLANEMWGSERPDSYLGIIRVSISRLRRYTQGASRLSENETLELDDTKSNALLRRVAGVQAYVLEIDRKEVDATRFSDLVDRGVKLYYRGQWQEADGLFEAALALAPGGLFEEVQRGSCLQAELLRMEAARDAAMYHRATIALLEEQPRRFLHSLKAAWVDDQAKEQIAALLMLTLFRCQLGVEAGDVYLATKQFLENEYGRSPHPYLARLYYHIAQNSQELLEGDPGKIVTGFLSPP